MKTDYEPTQQELKEAWQRAGLWRGGHTFEKDMQVPCIAKTVRNVVIARHYKNQLPQQARLNLEVTA